jgi:transposase
MQHYSRDIKETMVTKLCSPGGPSVYQLARETGISSSSLRNWAQAFGEGFQMKKNQRSIDWSPEAKLKAVFETQSLQGEELGEYIRGNGLHRSDLEHWKQEALSGFSSKRGRPRKDPELAASQEEVKLLKKFPQTMDGLFKRAQSLINSGYR